ncbi:PREDICTED: thymus-specific serine protease [Chinchilla lanigera]|uniref:thymus-specific serine protease n=1 Tax=Chinchilla lanigera TaxID=34839 RepID=UPI0006988E88|nr:PREDICTED: thymus-specific serine protease [Chinchilla lanigera]
MAGVPGLCALLLASLCGLQVQGAQALRAAGSPAGLTPSAPAGPAALLLRRLRERVRRLQGGEGPGLGPRAGWLQQPLDPFNSSDGRTFLQRYWVNDRHWAGRDAPVFLHLGGEGSLGPGSVTAGHPAALAPAWGALVISLEHRFYGLSVPAGGLGSTQLRYLSSRHASAQVAPRQPLRKLGSRRARRERRPEPQSCPLGSALPAPLGPLLLPVFVTFSSKRPGKLRPPSRLVGAAGSPEGEGGRPVSAGPARASLGACGSLSRAEDRAELLEALQALVGSAVQYDGQTGAPLGVHQLCGLLLQGARNGSHPEAYLGLRLAAQVVMHSLGQRCLSSSRAQTVTQLKATEPQESGVGDRQWLYQTCTEFGFYVTCEDPGCPFPQLPALPSHLELCEQVFGLSASSVARAVAQTNSYYGGQAPGATRVLFVNGDTDPWQVLSVTQASGPSEAALLIPGASHCADMAPERPSDPASLRRGRQSILRQLQTWLGQAKEERQLGGPA